jgi:hypothetical protein
MYRIISFDLLMSTFLVAIWAFMFGFVGFASYHMGVGWPAIPMTASLFVAFLWRKRNYLKVMCKVCPCCSGTLHVDTGEGDACGECGATF